MVVYVLSSPVSDALSVTVDLPAVEGEMDFLDAVALGALAEPRLRPWGAPAEENAV